MIKKASLVLLSGLLSVGAFFSHTAHAQMQKGYADDKPDVTIDRSVLQDLKGYQPPPMFGGDMMPPTTNRIEVTSPSQPTVTPPPTARLTAPNAEDLLKHPTENFHVLTERNASAPMTAPDMDDDNGPLLPLPKDDVPTKTKASVKEVAKKDIKKDVKAPSLQKEKAKEKVEDKKSAPAKTTSPKVEEPVKPQPQKEAYRPKAPQSMPAVPPIKVEKNILPPMSSGSPLPTLPPTTDGTVAAEKPSVGLRMMDAALARQMESDETKIKEQLTATTVKSIPLAEKKPVPIAKKSEQIVPKKTLVFKNQEVTLSKNVQSQISANILPEIQKDKKARVQIISFATSGDNTESSARRISLARALAVRDYLKSQKIDVSRIDVRALATETNSVPPDKVDIVLLK